MAPGTRGRGTGVTRKRVKRKPPGGELRCVQTGDSQGNGVCISQRLDACGGLRVGDRVETCVASRYISGTCGQCLASWESGVLGSGEEALPRTLGCSHVIFSSFGTLWKTRDYAGFTYLCWLRNSWLPKVFLNLFKTCNF